MIWIKVFFSLSENLELIRRVTFLLSPSENMQFCNEQIRTQPLFSPPCASATYDVARMCRRKNISVACADRQSSICLASQYTRMFCAQGDSMPHRCLATGRWGAARRRPDTGMARDPAPCPLPGVMKNRQVDMTKIKSLLHKRQTSLYPGHEW